jgi:hypothetical protein
MVDATPGTICRLKANANSGKTPRRLSRRPENPDTEYPKFSSPMGCWADQSEMVVLFGTLLMYLERLTKPCPIVMLGARQFVLDTGEIPRQWMNLCTPFASPHPRATVPTPVLTHS